MLLYANTEYIFYINNTYSMMQFWTTVEEDGECIDDCTIILYASRSKRERTLGEDVYH